MSESVELVPMSDLAEINPRTVLPKGAECSFIGMEDVSEDGQWINRRTGSYLSGYTTFQANDVLFAKITPCMENGKGALVSDLVSDYGFGSTEFHVLRAKSVSDPRFISQWARSRILRTKAEAHMTGSAGQRRVPASFFEIFQVARFPLTEQRRIAAILDSVDEAIQSTERLIAKLEQVKQGLLHDLLTRGINESGHLRDLSHHPDEFADTLLGRLPRAWSVVHVAEIAEFVTSGSRGWAAYYADDGPLFVRIGNLTRKHINLRLDQRSFVRPPSTAEIQRTAIRRGDVLISITADLGIIGVASESLGEAYINQHIALVRPDTGKISGRWIGHFLASPRAQAQFTRLNDAGAKSGLNLPAVGRLLVAVPTRRYESDLIVSILDRHDETIATHSRSLTKFRLLKQGLMDDLLTGRVRVGAEEGVSA